jgi:hypothetical protein
MMMLAAERIQILLLYFTRITAVKFTASLLGAFFAVVLPATKRTAQVTATGITRVGKESNLAVLAASQTLSQLHFVS